jgi:hypothetical protein
MTSDAAVTDAAGEQSSAVSLERGIAVVGSHPQTVMLTPFDQPGWKIYACSPHNYEKRQLPRYDEWFEVHEPLADRTRAYPYLRWLEDCPKVWMRDKDAMHLFPGAIAYPEAEMKAEFGPFTFTSSIAFILAKAIKDCEAEGIENIGMFGIMQASANEYAYQRPGIQNLIWEAARRKIHVYAPDVSKLFEPQPDNF